MAEFSFVAPIVKGKTEAWRNALAEMKGPRNAAYKESRQKLGIKREHVSLQSTPMGTLRWSIWTLRARTCSAR